VLFCLTEPNMAKALRKDSPKPLTGSVDAAEIEKFRAMAEEWWDPKGKFKPLHKFNPVRVGFIRDRLAGLAGRDPLGPEPLRGLRVLDIGSGGGLLCEPLARLGATVTGIDATERSVHVARAHAEDQGLTIDYRFTTAEAVLAGGERFDAVLNMEVVEHVADPDAFLKSCAGLVRPGGLMVLATMNRTLKSYALAILGAEYVLRWLPRGTHDWKKFLKPSEVAAPLRAAGLCITEMTGVSYDPIGDSWSLKPHDLAVNYMLVARKS